jgi:hypothetical protein
MALQASTACYKYIFIFTLEKLHNVELQHLYLYTNIITSFNEERQQN